MIVILYIIIIINIFINICNCYISKNNNNNRYSNSNRIHFITYLRQIKRNTKTSSPSLLTTSSSLSSSSSSSNESIYNKNIINDINKNIDKNIKIDINYDNDNDDYNSNKTINDDIYDIIQLYLSADRNGNLYSVDPSILTNNGHILTQGRIYEGIILELLKNCKSSEETMALERVDNFLNGYIKTERKSRCRLKVNYILAGASSNRFEESILLLSECDEIDDDLIDYLDGLIKKSIVSNNGPLGLIDYEDNEDKEDNEIEDDNITIDVLRMIQRRLLAEKQTKGDINLKLLAQLLNEQSTKLRESLLYKSLNSMEKIESFTQYMNDGIQHMSQRNEKKSQGSPSLADDTLEKMKDILYSVETLFKKFKSETTFSTNSDDSNE